VEKVIHKTAIVDEHAEIAHGVEIGPYSIIGPNVKIGKNTKIRSHVVIEGWTTIGANCDIFQFASIGGIPQDLKYVGEECYVVIGDNTTIREYVTVNMGTAGGGKYTRVGSNCLLMACSHVAHDCLLGDGVILANAALLAGHVTLEDYAIVGGGSAVHQFVKIGRNTMVGGMSRVIYDVPPYCILGGVPTVVVGLNLVGIKRAGFSEDTIKLLKQAFRLLYRSELTFSDAIEQIKKLQQVAEIKHFIDFLTSAERGIMRQRPTKSKI
jgi:UDP-N-acetylglucosamine acyltransferase